MDKLELEERIDLDRKLVRDTVERLEKKRAKVLFELLEKHLGYKPSASETLTNLKYCLQADRSELFRWGETSIVTFRPLDLPFPSMTDSQSYTVTCTIGYHVHV